MFSYSLTVYDCKQANGCLVEPIVDLLESKNKQIKISKHNQSPLAVAQFRKPSKSKKGQT